MSTAPSLLTGHISNFSLSEVRSPKSRIRNLPNVKSVPSERGFSLGSAAGCPAVSQAAFAAPGGAAPPRRGARSTRAVVGQAVSKTGKYRIFPIIGTIVMGNYAVDLNNPENKAFNAEWHKAYGKDSYPDFMSAAAWDAASARPPAWAWCAT